MTKKIKAAGYIRVSGEGQTDNTSLPEQRRLIEDYISDHNYKPTQIYADEGISGTTTEGRPGILQALEDARAGKFNILIVKNIKRFGREKIDILLNRRALKNAGVKLVSITENLDDELLTTIKAALAEEEVKDIKERMYGGKISKAKRGVPGGRLPYARNYDRENEKWLENDKEKENKIKYAANEYLKGRSLQKIAKEVNISYSHLLDVLKNDCGNEWKEEYKALDEPVFHDDVPRLLPPDTIEKVKAQIEHNRTNNRTDRDSKYLLTGGYIYCWHCKKPLTGQPQHDKYYYYKHPSSASNDCNHFSTVSMPDVDEQVLDMIFDEIGDVAGFEEAIAHSLPTAENIKKLDSEIDVLEKRLKKIEGNKKKVFKRSLGDIFDEALIKEEMDKLNEAEAHVTEELDKKERKKASLPDVEEVKKQAHQIREDLLEEYQSRERFKEMTFEEKRRLLRFLFEGESEEYFDDEKKEPMKYGVYISKVNNEVSCTLFGRLRAYKHADDGKDERKPLFDLESFENESDKKDLSSHKKSDYRTNNFSRWKK